MSERRDTWVTSAEETQMITTAAIRNKPALYLHPIKIKKYPEIKLAKYTQ